MNINESTTRGSLLTYLRWCDKKMDQQTKEIQELRDEIARVRQELQDYDTRERDAADLMVPL